MNNSHEEVRQEPISRVCNCSSMHVSKVVKELKRKGLVKKEHRNTVEVINPYLLCSLIAYEREFLKPWWFRTPKRRDTKHVLNNTLYSITLDSAVKIKEDEEPDVLQAHVLWRHIEYLIDNFNLTPNEPNLIIYPAVPSQFNNQQIRNNYYLCTDYDIYTDLLWQRETKEAIKFMKKEELFL